MTWNFEKSAIIKALFIRSSLCDFDVRVYKELLWDTKIVKYIYIFGALLFSQLLMLVGKYFVGLSLFCKSYRVVSDLSWCSGPKNKIDSIMFNFIDNKFFKIISKIRLDSNIFLDSYLRSPKAINYRKYFLGLDKSHCVSLKYPREDDFEDRQGDLMVLKKFNPVSNEKGVLLIKFTESFAKFAALFDVRKIARRYRIILEPSWWGYQHAYFLFYLSLPTEVIIESPYAKDYDFIKRINHNFVPTRLGSGDWVDPDSFVDGKHQKKKYAVVMVGNWSKIKRHEALFKAVSKMPNKENIKIALIGYPSYGRTKNDILNEARRYNLFNNVKIYQNIIPKKVAQILRESKVNILLSKGEGANRGIYEGLFSGNVVILYKQNRGVNKKNINKYTGFLVDDDELPEIILDALRNYYKFDTGNWIRKNSGYIISTRKLNDYLKKNSKQNGEPWTEDVVEKKNEPNLLYACNNDRIRLLPEYKELTKFLLKEKE